MNHIYSAIATALFLLQQLEDLIRQANFAFHISSVSTRQSVGGTVKQFAILGFMNTFKHFCALWCQYLLVFMVEFNVFLWKLYGLVNTQFIHRFIDRDVYQPQHIWLDATRHGLCLQLASHYDHDFVHCPYLLTIHTNFWDSSNVLMSGKVMCRCDAYAYADKCKIQVSLLNIGIKVRATSWPELAVKSCRGQRLGSQCHWAAHTLNAYIT